MQALSLLRFQNGKRGKIDDVFDLVVALQDVDRLAHADQDRADHLGLRQALHQLIADVARFQAGEDQDVGLARPAD